MGARCAVFATAREPRASVWRWALATRTDVSREEPCLWTAGLLSRLLSGHCAPRGAPLAAKTSTWPGDTAA